MKSTKSQTQVPLVRAFQPLAQVLITHQISLASGNISHKRLPHIDSQNDVSEYGSVSNALSLASILCHTANWDNVLSTIFHIRLLALFIFPHSLHKAWTFSNQVNVLSSVLAILLLSFKYLFTPLNFFNILGSRPALLNIDGALHQAVANVNAISGAATPSHSGIYSQNCSPYFLTVLLFGLSSVSINLPTLKSASQYAAAGEFHHRLRWKTEPTVFTILVPNLQTVCQASAHCSPIGSCKCSNSFHKYFPQALFCDDLPCL